MKTERERVGQCCCLANPNATREAIEVCGCDECRVMAAAPELLAACELCVAILDDYPFEDFTAMTADLIPEALRKLRAAIDKVKGDQP